MNTCFMEKSYVVAAILWTKYLKFRESFVTLEECNIVSRLLQKKYNEVDMNVCITNVIDSDYFKVEEGIITINKVKNIDLQSIQYRYQGYIFNIDILITLWDENFILRSLRN